MSLYSVQIISYWLAILNSRSKAIDEISVD